MVKQHTVIILKVNPHFLRPLGLTVIRFIIRDLEQAKKLKITEKNCPNSEIKKHCLLHEGNSNTPQM